MRSDIACIPCVLRQTERLVKAAGAARSAAMRAGGRALAELQKSTLEEPPSIFTSKIIAAAMDCLGEPDPFKKDKIRQARLGRAAARAARRAVERSSDPVRTALRYAAAGNIIDVGTQSHIDLDRAVRTAGAGRFAIDHYPRFRKQLKTARTILYVLDNAGEIYFDLLLLGLLRQYSLTVAAKRAPILNDVTAREAQAAIKIPGARVIDTGSGYLGVDFSSLSKEFNIAYLDSDIVIAKGQANFESLVDRPRPVYFLLQAKCPVVARRLGVGLGESVFYYRSLLPHS